MSSCWIIMVAVLIIKWLLYPQLQWPPDGRSTGGGRPAATGLLRQLISQSSATQTDSTTGPRLLPDQLIVEAIRRQFAAHLVCLLYLGQNLTFEHTQIDIVSDLSDENFNNSRRHLPTHLLLALLAGLRSTKVLSAGVLGLHHFHKMPEKNEDAKTPHHPASFALQPQLFLPNASQYIVMICTTP
jgi:hypothetical protein